MCIGLLSHEEIHFKSHEEEKENNTHYLSNKPGLTQQVQVPSSKYEPSAQCHSGTTAPLSMGPYWLLSPGYA